MLGFHNKQQLFFLSSITKSVFVVKRQCLVWYRKLILKHYSNYLKVSKKIKNFVYQVGHGHCWAIFVHVWRKQVCLTSKKIISLTNVFKILITSTKLACKFQLKNYFNSCNATHVVYRLQAENVFAVYLRYSLFWRRPAVC